MRIPEHVAVIPDGNRRYAQSIGLLKKQGYGYGLGPGVEFLRLCIAYGIGEVTYYGFTTDNCKRPKEQVTAFVTACIDAIDMIKEFDVSLLVVGNVESKCFPKELIPYTRQRVDFNGAKTKVNFLVNYGWEWDLGCLDVRSNSRICIKDSLKSKDISRIDLIIRWGGRKRLSGLLPVQSVYADIYTIDEMWPEFDEQQFVDAINWYDTQDITLGG